MLAARAQSVAQAVHFSDWPTAMMTSFDEARVWDYDMLGLDEAEEDACLPTVWHHYDMCELDQWAHEPAAWLNSAPEAYVAFEEAAPPREGDLEDGVLFMTDAPLVSLASSLLSFFNKPRAFFVQVKYMKVTSIFSASCVVRARVFRMDGFYIIQLQDLGSDGFYDIVWQATDFLQGCGLCLWEPSF